MLCPFCQETIQDGAVKCRYCHEFLREEPQPLPAVGPSLTSPNHGKNLGSTTPAALPGLTMAAGALWILNGVIGLLGGLSLGWLGFAHREPGPTIFGLLLLGLSLVFLGAGHRTVTGKVSVRELRNYSWATAILVGLELLVVMRVHAEAPVYLGWAVSAANAAFGFAGLSAYGAFRSARGPA